MAEYYKLDYRRLTFLECWYVTRGFQALFLWIGKLLRIPIRTAYGIPYVDSVEPWEITEEELPAASRELLRQDADELAGLGFHSPVYYAVDTLMPLEVAVAGLLHDSGDMVATVVYTEDRTFHPPKEVLAVAIASVCDDGTQLVTTNRRREVNLPPGYKVQRRGGASAAELVEAHRQRLEHVASVAPFRRIQSRHELLDLLGESERRTIDYQIARRLWVPMSPEEVEEARRERQKVRRTAPSTEHTSAESEPVIEDGIVLQEPAPVSEHAEVLAEIERLQRKRPGWGQALFLLVISLVLFTGFGAAQWSWRFVLLLIPILFVHELGHYVAMRAFRYRNLRMFFIPFLGAAVSGQNYNVPGWKKVIVSLAGPVPGIVLGMGLGIAGLIWDQPLLGEAALLTLILNGFNLLPVLPLDGGWVMHSLVFSRHYLLDGLFRVLACAGLLLIGLASGDRILAYVAIPLFIGLPAAFRTARVTDLVRRQNIPTASPDDQSIPPVTADAIIGAIKQRFPRGLPNKLIAQYTLQVYESLNARPPGWIASVFLLGVHGTSFLLAAGFAVVLVIGQHGNFWEIAETAATMPQREVACGSIARQEGPAGEPLNDANTIVATFEDPDAARAAFQNLGPLQANTAATLFGETVLISVPAAEDAVRQQWVDAMERSGSEVFVESAVFRVPFRLTCIAPSAEAAEAIEAEVTEYFAAPAMHLVPPWASDDPRSDDVRAEHRKARQTWQKIHEALASQAADEVTTALYDRLDRAVRRGDKAVVKGLNEELARRRKELNRHALETLRSEARLDQELIGLYLEHGIDVDLDADPEDWQQPLAERMGQLPLSEGAPAAGADRDSTEVGHVVRNGLLLDFPWLMFRRVGDGAPALVKWLCDRGCVDVKYEFQVSGGFGEELFDELE